MDKDQIYIHSDEYSDEQNIFLINHNIARTLNRGFLLTSSKSSGKNSVR